MGDAEALCGVGEISAYEHARIGDQSPLDYQGARKNARLLEQGITPDEATTELIDSCRGLINPVHPCTQRQIVPPVTSSITAPSINSSK